MEQAYGPEWQVISWIVTIGASVAIAVLVATRTPGRRWSALPAPHVAAATIIAIFGWEAAAQVPGIVAAVSTTYAGIENAAGQGVYQLFAATWPVLVVAAFAATVGLIRRRPWAVALGIGLCTGAVVQTAFGAANLVTMSGQFGDPNLGLFALDTIARGIPPVVAIGLLLLPIVGGTVFLEPSGLPAPPPAREEEVGVIEGGAPAGDRP